MFNVCMVIGLDVDRYNVIEVLIVGCTVRLWFGWLVRSEVRRLNSLTCLFCV